MVIPIKFDNAGKFAEGLAPVMLGNKWGYLNRAGKLVIAPKFKEAEPFREGLAAVAVEVGDETKWGGGINKQGKFVIKPAFDCTASFFETLT